MTGGPAEDRELMRELDALSRARGREPDSAPPAAVDAAVLARARAAAGRRRVPTWWVPATLAATVVIAFSLMLRVQEETSIVPAATDSSRTGEVQAESAAPAATAPASAEIAVTSPQVEPEAPPAAPPAPAAGSSAADVATLRAAPRAKAAAPLPEPEAWLARIEALEADGRMQEAAAERERLEAAYPGWLEQWARGRD